MPQISQLPAAGTLTSAELIPLSQNGIASQASIATILAAISVTSPAVDLSAQLVIPTGASTAVALSDISAQAVAAAFPVATIAALRDLTAATTSTVADVAGYATAADGGGGIFVVNAADTTSADNGGTIIVDAAGRRWYRQFSGPIDVRWFGANQSNDIGVILSAINAANPTGADVYIPAGTFQTAQLTTVGSLFIRGAGVELTTINITSASTGFIEFAANTNGGRLSDMWLEPTTTQTGGSLITLGADSLQIVLENLRITNAYNAINVMGVVHFLKNMYIESSINYGIWLQSGNDRYMTNIVMDNAAGNTTSTGIMVQNSGGDFFCFCDVIHHNYGMQISPQNSGEFVSWLSVTNCDFDTSTTYGLLVQPSSAATYGVYGCNFDNCWFSTSGQHGIYLNALSVINGISFNQARILNNYQDGATIADPAVKNISFVDCSISGNSQTSSGTYSGISIGPGVSDFKIQNCIIGQMDNFANTQARGILINSGASNNYIITENDVRNNTSAGILDGGSGTNKLVHSNLGYNETTSSTAISVTASPFTYTNNSGAPQLIVVDGGSVSAITIFGQTVYTATGQSFILPTGQSTTVTYTSAPTMTFGFLT